MSHDFSDDLNTPTEEDLESCYGSKYLSALEIGGRKIRTKIARVRKQALQQQGGATRNKFVLSFSSLDKEMVLNATNKTILVDVLGRNPADWIGAEVGIYSEPTTFGGKPTRGLRLRVLNKPGNTTPAPKPAPKPVPMPAVGPWPDQPGDPGPDFNEAAG